MASSLFEINQFDDVSVSNHAQDFDLHLHPLIVFALHLAEGDLLNSDYLVRALYFPLEDN